MGAKKGITSQGESWQTKSFRIDLQSHQILLNLKQNITIEIFQSFYAKISMKKRVQSTSIYTKRKENRAQIPKSRLRVTPE